MPVRVTRYWIKQRLKWSQHKYFQTKGIIIKEVKEGKITMSYQIENSNKETDVIKTTKNEILEFISTSMPEMKDITRGAQEIWSSRRKQQHICT